MTERSELIADALGLLRAHGVTPRIQENGRHIKLRWVDAGQPRMLVISRSPSDRRARRQSRALLKRIPAECKPEWELAMTHKPARDLIVGDIFRLHVYGEVIAVTPVVSGKRIRVRIELEDQGHRSNRDYGFLEGGSSLEFTNTGHVLEFLCKPNRKFHVIEDDWDDDGDDEDIDLPMPPTPAWAK